MNAEEARALALDADVSRTTEILTLKTYISRAASDKKFELNTLGLNVPNLSQAQIDYLVAEKFQVTQRRQRVGDFSYTISWAPDAIPGYHPSN
jgi:hypothetical protein